MNIASTVLAIIGITVCSFMGGMQFERSQWIPGNAEYVIYEGNCTRK